MHWLAGDLLLQPLCVSGADGGAAPACARSGGARIGRGVRALGAACALAAPLLLQLCCMCELEVSQPQLTPACALHAHACPCRERYAQGDKSCDAPIIPAISGYCLCEDNITTARYASTTAWSSLAVRQVGRSGARRRRAVSHGAAAAWERPLSRARQHICWRWRLHQASSDSSSSSGSMCSSTT